MLLYVKRVEEKKNKCIEIILLMATREAETTEIKIQTNDHMRGIKSFTAHSIQYFNFFLFHISHISRVHEYV